MKTFQEYMTEEQEMEVLTEGLIEFFPWLRPIRLAIKKFKHEELSAMTLYAQLIQQGKAQHDAIHVAASTFGYTDKGFSEILHKAKSLADKANKSAQNKTAKMDKFTKAAFGSI